MREKIFALILLAALALTSQAKETTWRVHIDESTEESTAFSVAETLNPNEYKESIKTGDDLRKFIMAEKHKKDKGEILVVVWFKNEYGHWYLNRNNQEVRGTLMNILKKNHPKILYHEIDMSEYNRNADTFEELAEELGIDLKMLYDAPIVLVIYDEKGDAFTTDKGSLALVKTIDKYIHKEENQLFDENNQLCNVEQEIQYVSNFKVPTLPEMEIKEMESTSSEIQIKSRSSNSNIETSKSNSAQANSNNLQTKSPVEIQKSIPPPPVQPSPAPSSSKSGPASKPPTPEVTKPYSDFDFDPFPPEVAPIEEVYSPYPVGGGIHNSARPSARLVRYPSSHSIIAYPSYKTAVRKNY